MATISQLNEETVQRGRAALARMREQDAEIAAALERSEQQNWAYVRECMARARQDLQDSAGHCVRQYTTDLSAVVSWSMIVWDLDMLELLARQTAALTGVQLQAPERLLLNEASALRALKTPEQVNAWLSVHDERVPVRDPRGFDAQPWIYATGLGFARTMLVQVLRILERVGDGSL
jgi:hypothetical protein